MEIYQCIYLEEYNLNLELDNIKNGIFKKKEELDLLNSPLKNIMNPMMKKYMQL